MGRKRYSKELKARIAMAICCAFSAERHVNQVWNEEGVPDVFIPIIFGLLVLWPFYVGLKKNPSE